MHQLIIFINKEIRTESRLGIDENNTPIFATLTLLDFV